MRMAGRRGDRQLAADRLGPVDPAVIVDEGDHGFDRRSSSAAANTRRPCAGSRWPGAAPGSPAPAPSTAPVPRSSAQPLAPVALGLPDPLPQASPPCSRLTPSPSTSPPIPTRAPAPALEPSAPNARAAWPDRASPSPSSPWLHSLRRWSLRETRRGSVSAAPRELK
jgi:hypothetical protein